MHFLNIAQLNIIGKKYLCLLQFQKVINTNTYVFKLFTKWKNLIFSTQETAGWEVTTASQRSTHSPTRSLCGWENRTWKLWSQEGTHLSTRLISTGLVFIFVYVKQVFFFGYRVKMLFHKTFKITIV